MLPYSSCASGSASLRCLAYVHFLRMSACSASIFSFSIPLCLACVDFGPAEMRGSQERFQLDAQAPLRLWRLPPWRTVPSRFFFLFIHYSRASYLDHGEDRYSPFPVHCPHNASSLQASLLPSAQACPENVWCAPKKSQKKRTKEKSERV